MKLCKISLVMVLMTIFVNSVTAMLAADAMEKCKDEAYLFDNSDYVVVGKVSKVEIKWADNNIHTYQYVEISDYLKGSELDNDLLIIDSQASACVGTICQYVEDGDTVLKEDKEYTLYLSNKGNYFSIYCNGYGAKLKTELDEDEPISDKDTEEPITDKDIVEPISDKDQLEQMEDKDIVEIVADKDIVEPIEVQIDTPEGESKIKIEKISEDSISIEEKDTSIKTSKKLIIEEKKLFMETAKKEKKEIKVMPSTASETAIAQLSLKYAEIELKEVGKPIYEITGKKEVKIFGLFKKEMTVKTQIDAETGNIEKTKKPWWSFLATG